MTDCSVGRGEDFKFKTLLSSVLLSWTVNLSVLSSVNVKVSTSQDWYVSQLLVFCDYFTKTKKMSGSKKMVTIFNILISSLDYPTILCK